MHIEPNRRSHVISEVLIEHRRTNARHRAHNCPELVVGHKASNSWAARQTLAMADDPEAKEEKIRVLDEVSQSLQRSLSSYGSAAFQYLDVPVLRLQCKCSQPCCLSTLLIKVAHGRTI